MLLAGDIGGTKTHLGVYETVNDLRKPFFEATFPSARYPSLEAIIGEFLDQFKMPVDCAGFGVAGPVVNERATLTNLRWAIDAKQLSDELNLSSIHLINDVEAVAYYASYLEPADLCTLNAGKPSHEGPIAVLAPGTGLGEAYAIWDGFQYHACASEGGHTDFAPNNPLEIELLRYLQKSFDHVSWERVCSGPGIYNIHRYLEDTGFPEEEAQHARELAADDPTPIIVNAALNKEAHCEICVVTLEAFVSILGAEAGNLALRFMATNGVYLAGGIPPRILPALTDGRFMKAFKHKGRMSELVSQIPVHVILNPRVTIMGAARAAWTHKQQRKIIPH